jgi:hypothetical protein
MDPRGRTLQFSLSRSMPSNWVPSANSSTPPSPSAPVFSRTPYSVLGGQGAQPDIGALHRREAAVDPRILPVKLAVNEHGNALSLGLGHQVQVGGEVWRDDRHHHPLVAAGQQLESFLFVLDGSDGAALLLGPLPAVGSGSSTSSGMTPDRVIAFCRWVMGVRFGGAAKKTLTAPSPCRCAPGGSLSLPR